MSKARVSDRFCSPKKEKKTFIRRTPEFPDSSFNHVFPHIPLQLSNGFAGGTTPSHNLFASKSINPNSIEPAIKEKRAALRGAYIDLCVRPGAILYLCYFIDPDNYASVYASIIGAIHLNKFIQNEFIKRVERYRQEDSTNTKSPSFVQNDNWLESIDWEESFDNDDWLDNIALKGAFDCGWLDDVPGREYMQLPGKLEVRFQRFISTLDGFEDYIPNTSAKLISELSANGYIKKETIEELLQQRESNFQDDRKLFELIRCVQHNVGQKLIVFVVPSEHNNIVPSSYKPRLEDISKNLAELGVPTAHLPTRAPYDRELTKYIQLSTDAVIHYADQPESYTNYQESIQDHLKGVFGEVPASIFEVDHHGDEVKMGQVRRFQAAQHNSQIPDIPQLTHSLLSKFMLDTPPQSANTGFHRALVGLNPTEEAKNGYCNSIDEFLRIKTGLESNRLRQKKIRDILSGQSVENIPPEVKLLDGEIVRTLTDLYPLLSLSITPASLSCIETVFTLLGLVDPVLQGAISKEIKKNHFLVQLTKEALITDIGQHLIKADMSIESAEKFFEKAPDLREPLIHLVQQIHDNPNIIYAQVFPEVLEFSDEPLVQAFKLAAIIRKGVREIFVKNDFPLNKTFLDELLSLIIKKIEDDKKKEVNLEAEDEAKDAKSMDLSPEIHVSIASVLNENTHFTPIAYLRELIELDRKSQKAHRWGKLIPAYILSSKDLVPDGPINKILKEERQKTTSLSEEEKLQRVIDLALDEIIKKSSVEVFYKEGLCMLEGKKDKCPINFLFLMRILRDNSPINEILTSLPEKFGDPKAAKIILSNYLFYCMEEINRNKRESGYFGAREAEYEPIICSILRPITSLPIATLQVKKEAPQKEEDSQEEDLPASTTETVIWEGWMSVGTSGISAKMFKEIVGLEDKRLDPDNLGANAARGAGSVKAVTPDVAPPTSIANLFAGIYEETLKSPAADIIGKVFSWVLGDAASRTDK